jgi:hypothetical protein
MLFSEYSWSCWIYQATTLIILGFHEPAEGSHTKSQGPNPGFESPFSKQWIFYTGKISEQCAIAREKAYRTRLAYASSSL